jgi:hypothetical protein
MAQRIAAARLGAGVHPSLVEAAVPELTVALSPVVSLDQGRATTVVPIGMDGGNVDCGTRRSPMETDMGVWWMVLSALLVVLALPCGGKRPHGLDRGVSQRSGQT